MASDGDLTKDDSKDRKARRDWGIGSNLDVYSRSKGKWYRGIISKINGPYITVQYRIESGEVGEKDVHRTDEIIRPTEEQLQDPEVAYYMKKIMDIFKGKDPKYIDYASEMFGRDEVAGNERGFYEQVCEKYGVTPEPPYNSEMRNLELETQRIQAELFRVKNENLKFKQESDINTKARKSRVDEDAMATEMEVLRTQLEELTHLNESMKSMAYADSLTQKLNKRAFDRDLSSANSAPFQKGLATVVVAKFDQVRSLMGRQHANEVLYEIAQQLEAAVERVSKNFTNKVLIYRVSGDEFSILIRFTADDVKNADAHFSELLQLIGKVTVYVTKKGSSFQVQTTVTDEVPEVVCGVYVGGHLANPVNYDVCDNLQRVVHSVYDHVSRGTNIDQDYKDFHERNGNSNVAVHRGQGDDVVSMPPVSCILGKGDAEDSVIHFINTLKGRSAPPDPTRAESEETFKAIAHGPEDELLDDDIDEF